MEILLTKNSGAIRLLFLLFFGIALLTELINRYHYSFELRFRFTFRDLELATLLVLTLFNPRGIKLVLALILLFLMSLTAYLMLFSHLSGFPSILIFKDLLRFLHVPHNLFYLLHILLFSSMLIALFYGKRVTNNEQLIDQTE